MTTPSKAAIAAGMDRKHPPQLTTRTWRLTVAYHGAGFAGWQVQPGARSVQQELQRALSVLAGAPVLARAAGRTDAGVHARAQAVSTTMTSRIEPHKMALALCSLLPDDISVTHAQVMPEGFNAKFHAIGKRYVYRVHAAVHRCPFRAATSWHVRGAVDVEAMKAAAAVFVGEHDFESFRSTHCDAEHARRYLWRSEVEVRDELISYEVRGNAFCRHMVRGLAGTLVDVGRGKLKVHDVARIIAAKNRRVGGVTAPAAGLTLEDVYYPDTLGNADLPTAARFPGYPIDPFVWPPRVRVAVDEQPHDPFE